MMQPSEKARLQFASSAPGKLQKSGSKCFGQTRQRSTCARVMERSKCEKIEPAHNPRHTSSVKHCGGDVMAEGESARIQRNASELLEQWVIGRRTILNTQPQQGRPNSVMLSTGRVGHPKSSSTHNVFNLPRITVRAKHPIQARNKDGCNPGLSEQHHQRRHRECVEVCGS